LLNVINGCERGLWDIGEFGLLKQMMAIAYYTPTFASYTPSKTMIGPLCPCDLRKSFSRTHFCFLKNVFQKLIYIFRKMLFGIHKFTFEKYFPEYTSPSTENFFRINFSSHPIFWKKNFVIQNIITENIFRNPIHPSPFQISLSTKRFWKMISKIHIFCTRYRK